MNILTPAVFGDSIFTSSYGGKAWLFQVGRDGEAFTLDEVWNDNKQAYMSTPVFIDNHAYLHLKNQRFTCIDLRTGETKWTTKPYGKYWSLVANGDRILALDQRGDLLLIRATPEKFDLLDEREDIERLDVGSPGRLWPRGVCSRAKRHDRIPLGQCRVRARFFEHHLQRCFAVGSQRSSIAPLVVAEVRRVPPRPPARRLRGR